MSNNTNELYRFWASIVPEKPETSVVEWCRKKVRLVGSARSEAYDPDITPWTKEPLECADNGTRKMTFPKPIQSGGSDVGENAIYYWIATKQGGDIQYNWQNDKKAYERWAKRVEKRMKACAAIMARAVASTKFNKGLVVYPHCNFTMQGVFSDTSVASDSVRFQVNEELHDDSAQSGWSDDGRLDQAYGRTTAFWNSVVFNISNAGKRGSQLHRAYESGTKQIWRVFCPGCQTFHAMRMRFEVEKPQLGGLRYDREKNLRKDGTLDYFALLSTIRYQMPCGYVVHEDVRERRALSLSGCYSPPTNAGAMLSERSYTLEAVSVDYIPWVDLIKQKEEALRQLAWGKGDAWWTYLRERECQFTSDADRPIMQKIALTPGRTKNREGLPNRTMRAGAGDYQKGHADLGELPHWWVVIMDIEIEPSGRAHILIVYEGKETTDNNMVSAFTRHGVEPSCVALDSGWNTKHVYNLCMENGFYAVKDEDTPLYAGHEDGSRKIYSPPTPLHAMINFQPKFNYISIGKGEYREDPREPMFVRVSKFGMMDRLAWMRSTPDYCWFDVPEDVSEDFKAHLDAWKDEKKTKKDTSETHNVYVQRRDDDHLLKCCCYIGVIFEDAALFGPITPDKPADAPADPNPHQNN